MDTNTNTTETNQVEIIAAAKNPVGRPRSVHRKIYLDVANKTIRPRGRVQHNSVWLEVEIERAVKSSEFQYGVTKIFSEKQVTVEKPVKEVPHNIQVTVIESAPVIAESADTQTTHESFSSPQVLA